MQINRAGIIEEGFINAQHALSTDNFCIVTTKCIEATVNVGNETIVVLQERRKISVDTLIRFTERFTLHRQASGNHADKVYRVTSNIV